MMSNLLVYFVHVPLFVSFAWIVFALQRGLQSRSHASLRQATERRINKYSVSSIDLRVIKDLVCI